MQQTNDQCRDNDSQSYAKWLGFGIEFCGVLAVFCYIGYRLDMAWNTSPWLLLTGFFIGFTGMFYTIFKSLRKHNRK